MPAFFNNYQNIKMLIKNMNTIPEFFPRIVSARRHRTPVLEAPCVGCADGT